MTFSQRCFVANFRRSFLCSLATILALNSVIDLSTAIGQEDAIKTAKATAESSRLSVAVQRQGSYGLGRSS